MAVPSPVSKPSQKITPQQLQAAQSALRNTFKDITAKIDPKIVQRAKQVRVALKRADARNMRFLFWARSTPSQTGNTHQCGVRFVRGPGGQQTAVHTAKLNCLMYCGCPFWQWWGSDYWAKREAYLLGKPFSNQQFPAVRDPRHIKPVCKHLYAASRLFLNYRARR